ncbi:unnamed protein product [Lymnaea stagnalis]|uniref:Uncharacterized protein n=1 Tax=Lymnaea stagnalis TaxID=6523 RepID=A0AAV2HS04_LYMST
MSDTSCHHLWYAAKQCLCHQDEKYRKKVEEDLQGLWLSDKNTNHVMPLLSVRTGLDLFLSAKNFPKGSEIIMSAINIPDMGKIVKSHNLVIVSLDVSIETLEPKLDILPKLITTKTVAIIVAHLYGRIINMEPIIEFAHLHRLVVIEDCAESFCGFQNMGHPSSDVALFSFGVIKFYTSFGGCIAKIRDIEMYQSMQNIHRNYPIQTADMYLKKIVKYSFIYSWLHVGPLPKIGREVLNRFGVDYKAHFVRWMRGFPERMLEMIRWQPSTALLSTMLYRQQGFTQSEFEIQKKKGDYILSKLPVGYEPVGNMAMTNNYWLFPVLVDEPDELGNILNLLGVDAYRGATQLNLVEPCHEVMLGLFNGSEPLDKLYPHEAKYLIDHVLYLPVNKFVPYHHLDAMLKACTVAMEISKQKDRKPLHHKLKLLKSKL